MRGRSSVEELVAKVKKLKNEFMKKPLIFYAKNRYLGLIDLISIIVCHYYFEEKKNTDTHSHEKT